LPIMADIDESVYLDAAVAFVLSSPDLAGSEQLPVNDPRLRAAVESVWEARGEDWGAGYDAAVEELRGVHGRTGSPAARWSAEYLDARRRWNAELPQRWRETLARAERAEAEVVENTGVMQALRRQRDVAEAKLAEVEEAVGRVRALHAHSTRQSPSGAHTYVACAVCGYADGGKCPTIAALDAQRPVEGAPADDDRFSTSSAGGFQGTAGSLKSASPEGEGAR
jgi:hypothetical protein